MYNIILQCIFCFCLLLTVAASVAVTASVSASAAARWCCCCYCRRLPFMFLLLLFIRLFERQRNGRVAKLPLRTFFVLLWACVCVRAVCTSASNSFAFYNCTKKKEGLTLSVSFFVWQRRAVASRFVVGDLSRDFSLLFYNGVAINTHIGTTYGRIVVKQRGRGEAV